MSKAHGGITEDSSSFTNPMNAVQMRRRTPSGGRSYRNLIASPPSPSFARNGKSSSRRRLDLSKGATSASSEKKSHSSNNTKNHTEAKLDNKTDGGQAFSEEAPVHAKAKPQGSGRNLHKKEPEDENSNRHVNSHKGIDSMNGWCATDDPERNIIYYFHGSTKEAAKELPEGEDVLAWVVRTDDANRKLVGDLGVPHLGGTSLEGWVMKTDPHGRYWKTRWLELKLQTGDLIWYKHNPELTLKKYNVEERPIGQMSIRGATAKISSYAEKHKYCSLDIKGKDRNLILIPDSNLSLLRWKHFIESCASSTGNEIEENEDDFEVEKSEPRSVKGWLKKTGPASNTWTDRYVEVDADSGILLYAENQSLSVKSIKGIVNLRNAEISLGINGEFESTKKSLTKFPVFYVYPEKTTEGQRERGFNFMAQNKDELKTWVSVLRGVSSSWSSARSRSISATHTRPKDDSSDSADGFRDHINPLHASSHPSRKGWMWKSDPYGHSWKNRYIVLRLNCLEYYKSEKAEKSSGHISLVGAKVGMGNSATKGTTPFDIILEDSERIYFFNANTKSEMISWYDSLLEAIREAR